MYAYICYEHTASMSKWLVGSSKRSRVGWMKRARANAIRMRQPPYITYRANLLTLNDTLTAECMYVCMHLFVCTYRKLTIYVFIQKRYTNTSILSVRMYVNVSMRYRWTRASSCFVCPLWILTRKESWRHEFLDMEFDHENNSQKYERKKQ